MVKSLPPLEQGLGEPQSQGEGISNTKGVPPALPGRQSKFDVSGGLPQLKVDEASNRQPLSIMVALKSAAPHLIDVITGESATHRTWCGWYIRRSLFTAGFKA